MSARQAVNSSKRADKLETCDRCGIRARVHVVLGSGGDLYLCRRHAREHRAALRPIARLEDLPV